MYVHILGGWVESHPHVFGIEGHVRKVVQNLKESSSYRHIVMNPWTQSPLFDFLTRKNLLQFFGLLF